MLTVILNGQEVFQQEAHAFNRTTVHGRAVIAVMNNGSEMRKAKQRVKICGPNIPMQNGDPSMYLTNTI
jgi:hypothetical protein